MLLTNWGSMQQAEPNPTGEANTTAYDLNVEVRQSRRWPILLISR
jgi:hypothetical protein